MSFDWSTTGSGIPSEALRASDNLKVLSPVKARASRIFWEKGKSVVILAEPEAENAADR